MTIAVSTDPNGRVGVEVRGMGPTVPPRVRPPSWGFAPQARRYVSNRYRVPPADETCQPWSGSAPARRQEPLSSDGGSGVAADVEGHDGDLDAVREREERPVDLSPADDPGVAVADEPERLVDPVHDERARGLEPGRPGEHDVVAAGQRPEPGRQRRPRRAAHDHRVPAGEVAEVGHVLGDVPRQRAVAPDDPGGGLGPDERQAHTATGALMAGWYW